MNQLAVVSAQTSRPTIIGASPACFPVGALSAGSAAKRVYHAIPELHETGTANRLRLAGRRLNIEARRVEARDDHAPLAALVLGGGAGVSGV